MQFLYPILCIITSVNFGYGLTNLKAYKWKLYWAKNIEFTFSFHLASISCSLAGTVVLALFQVLPIVQLIEIVLTVCVATGSIHKLDSRKGLGMTLELHNVVYKPPPSFNLPTNSTTRYPFT